MKNTRGFTWIELVVVIIVLGILAAVAIPTFINYRNQAYTAAEKGVLGGVRAGIMTYYVIPVNNYTYPALLDNASVAACSNSNPCFTNVVAQGGITADWIKASATTYIGPAGNTYTYTSSTGLFQ